MIDLILQYEARARVAEMKREAEAARRATVAKSGSRGSASGLDGRLTRPGIDVNTRRVRFEAPSGLRDPPVNGS
jgi:hypothetical protein